MKNNYHLLEDDRLAEKFLSNLLRPTPSPAPIVSTLIAPLSVTPPSTTSTFTSSASTRSTTSDPTADDIAAAIATTAATTATSVAATATEFAKLAYKDYTHDRNDYLLSYTTSKCLVKQILKAVPTIYIEELEDPITKLGKLVPHTLLQHLKDTYGVVSDRDIDTNLARTKTKWMLYMPIEALFRQLGKAKHFAKEAGEEIQDFVLCRAGYNNLHVTGLFSQPCY